MSGLSRRAFLGVSVATGAGFAIGFPLASQRSFGASAQTPEINAWIRIGTDSLVTLVVPEAEMGQGVLTALPMILAEELEADWRNVRSIHAPADRERYGRQSTGGSTSVRKNYEQLRRAGAAAREMLISAAAETWGVPAGQCRAEAGHVIDAKGRRMSFGAVAERASQQPVPKRPKLKNPETFRLIGRTLPRLDSETKVRGEAVYGIDVQMKGLKTARVAHPPSFGGTLRSVDATRALAIDGVRAVKKIPTGVAVIADHYWAATQGVEALALEWEDGPHGALDSAKIRNECTAALTGGRVVRSEGDATRALRRSEAPIEATYHVPFLAHATMEPMNCTARVTADRCELWAPTQSPTGAQDAAATITGLPLDRIAVHTTFMGGGFGRRSVNDFVADAVHCSKAAGTAVKVVYSREDDMRAGAYRPVSAHGFRGTLDGDGWPLAWQHRLACPSILGSKGWLQGDVDGTSVEGAANLPYAIPNLEVRYNAADVPVPPHFWRSVGSSQNAYVTECFLDELARAGGKDPVELRHRFLTHHPRHRRVLEAAAEKAGWGSPVAEGRARGVAVHECFGSVVAEVVEVSLAADQSVRVHNVVCAVDCGLAINPGIIAAQMESGIVYGLSAALYGQITIERGRAVEGNFDRYPVLRMREMPAIETVIVDSDAPIGGIGEPSTPPIAPAVCNALQTLTGQPARELPLRPVRRA